MHHRAVDRVVRDSEFVAHEMHMRESVDITGERHGAVPPRQGAGSRNADVGAIPLRRHVPPRAWSLRVAELGLLATGIVAVVVVPEHGGARTRKIPLGVHVLEDGAVDGRFGANAPEVER
jgi:hypothetical protein